MVSLNLVSSPEMHGKEHCIPHAQPWHGHLDSRGREALATLGTEQALS